MKYMKVPDCAADLNEKTDKEKVIINPYHGKEILSRKEALDLINHISGALLADEHYRS